MNLNEYQVAAKHNSKVKDDDTPYFMAIWGLGIAGEAGEVADHIKKVLRDDDGVITAERRPELGDELGDVLWYIARIAGIAGFTLEEVAQGNISKLKAINAAKETP